MYVCIERVSNNNLIYQQVFKKLRVGFLRLLSTVGADSRRLSGWRGSYTYMHLFGRRLSPSTPAIPRRAHSRSTGETTLGSPAKLVVYK